MSGQNPRQIAAEILRQRQVSHDFTEDLLEKALTQSELSAVDRGLCHELAYGVVRWQATLDWFIARKTDGRKQKPVLQNLLRLGLYQIFWLDRIPGHAAVHETVELVKKNGLGAQAGFVNAVLRGYLREVEAAKKLLAELKISRPELGWSHPGWLVARWQKRWGAQKTARLLEWNNMPPKNFARVNTLQIDAGKLLEKWRKENVEYEFVRRDWLPGNLVFELKSHPPLVTLASFQRGNFYIQDPSTLLAVVELNPKPGETILDFCAAPGGKTTFMAQLMKNQGRIVAQDVSEERLKLIQENCRRLGTTCFEYILPSTFRLQASAFDRILVDAPCSNTGVMRRRVDSRWRLRQGEFKRLQQIQLDLLCKAAPKVKPGGVLVYSTCSLEPEESQEVVKQFLQANKEFKVEFERELLPFVDQVDGAFVARLKRLP
ncbi:MAG TPA: 16S rRNA (cytosine(967)-C(5))-methyltransferase RsmB [Candidatus Saccharimonadales bacterium]|nr:16S rRNA (cytosine(967)-C(5))-methyltransferase RsmB [Candidatus Saccharimonadales bacterium]